MPEPKENPQTNPDPLRQEWNRAVERARRDRNTLGRVSEQTRETGRMVRETLEGRQLPSGYERFFLGNSASQMVIQGTERIDGQRSDAITISYTGYARSARSDLESHYPDDRYTITDEQDGTINVRRKSDSVLVSRARRNEAPRFLRAILAHNRVIDRVSANGEGTLASRAGFEQAGATAVLCAQPEQAIATIGGRDHNLNEYLDEVHDLRILDGRAWGGHFILNASGGVMMDLITDARSIRILQTLRPLAQRARTEETARQELQGHMRSIDLPASIYPILMQDLLAPKVLTFGELNEMKKCSPANRLSLSENNRAMERGRIIAADRWTLLEQTGMVLVAPESGAQARQHLRVNTTGENDAGIVVSGERGSIDIGDQYLPRDWSMQWGTGYAYNAVGRSVTAPRERSNDPNFIFDVFHEIGHAADPNLAAMTAEAQNVETLLRNSRIPAERQQLLQRRLAFLRGSIESFAWRHALTLAGRTRQRTGWDVVRNRYQNCTQFVHRVVSAYRTYLPKGEFARRLFDVDGLEARCRFHWASGEAEEIIKIANDDARKKAVDTFNFRYGPLSANAFHAFGDAPHGQFLALNEQGTLQFYTDRQTFESARNGAKAEVTPITTRWWEGCSPAARVARQLEYFHRLSNQPEAFNLTLAQLETCERLLAERRTGSPEGRLMAIQDLLRAQKFTDAQIKFLTHGGFFDPDLVTHIRTSRQEQLNIERALRIAAATSALDDYTANQQRYRNPQGEPSFSALRPIEQQAIDQAVSTGANTRLDAEERLRNIRQNLTPPFTPAQRELMITEGHFDAPGENTIATRARNNPPSDLTLNTLPVHERIWLRGGLDAGNTSMADIIKVAQDLKIDVTNLSDIQRRQRVEERVNTLMGRRG